MDTNVLSEDTVLAARGFTTVVMLVVLAVQARAYFLDDYRQALFAVRRRLFDYAEAGVLSFEDPAYRSAVRQINRSIRWAHCISTPLLVVPLTWECLTSEIGAAASGRTRPSHPILRDAMIESDRALLRYIFKRALLAAAAACAILIARSILRDLRQLRPEHDIDVDEPMVQLIQRSASRVERWTPALSPAVARAPERVSRRT